MNGIVETYLTFKSNNVTEYIKILSEEQRMVSKIPRQLNKLIYKYYDLFVLSDKKVDYELLKNKTGLTENYDKLILFYLLIEFDMTSKTELSKEKLYNFYNFLVNSTIIFIELENSISRNKEHYSYDESIQKVLKQYNEYIDADYVLLLDKLYVPLKQQYNRSVKKYVKFKEMYISDKFISSYSKVKNSNNLYLNKFKYRNTLLNTESRKDIELIHKEYAIDINFINIEMVTLNILLDAFTEKKQTIFVELEDEIFKKKVYLDKLERLLRLRVIKENIIFLVNIDVLENNEDNINYLIDKEINLSFKSDLPLTKKNIYKKAKYLFIDYDENLKENLKQAKELEKEVIIKHKGNIKKDKLQELDNIMYVN